MLQGMLKLQPHFLGMIGKACPRRVGSQQKRRRQGQVSGVGWPGL